MKRIWKSVLSLMLILSMVLPLAACGGGEDVVEEMTYPGQDEMTFEELLEMDRQNPITIQIMVADLTEPAASDSAVLKAIAEKTGTTIELVGVDTDRLQMFLASKEYPDVIVMNRDATFYNYLESGDLADLAPLLKQWAPTVYDMNSEMIEIFTNEEGQLLYLTENNDLLREGEKHPEDATDPTRAQDELPWHSTVYVQYPMVKEIYGEKITTFDQYQAALDAFIAEYGDEKGMYAISYDKDSAGDILWAGLSMYGYKCMYKGGLYVTKDGENYSYGLKTGEAEEWLLFLNRLYREGYIYEEASIQSYDQFIRQMNKAKVFSFIGNYYAVYEANKNMAGNKMSQSYIPQKIMAEGVDQVYQYNAAYTGAGAFVVLNSSPNKARIARLLEYLYSDEGSILHGWGIEGEDYIINEDGVRDITAEIADKKNNEDYDLLRGIRALYSVINFPTYTSDGQPAFARFAPYLSSESGIDERDAIVRQDSVYNWHEDWKGTFYSDLSEMDIVMQSETPEAIASARCAAVVKDMINNIIMASVRRKLAACIRRQWTESMPTASRTGRLPSTSKSRKNVTRWENKETGR
ncbi:MAG: extracellular solute-binding protein [Lachnospiraceae bacterium]|nr:extracellular solute-binding protein [Lachnospiraceae bacterium]